MNDMQESDKSSISNDNYDNSVQAFLISMLAETVLFGSLWGGGKVNELSDEIEKTISDYLRNKEQNKEGGEE